MPAALTVVNTVTFSFPEPCVVLVHGRPLPPTTFVFEGSRHTEVSSIFQICSGLCIPNSSKVSFSKVKYSVITNGSVILFLRYSTDCGFLIDRLCRKRNEVNQSGPGRLSLKGVIILFALMNSETMSKISVLDKPQPHFSNVRG